ncbi:MAG TPA: ribbon-helix-helix protein, CopG family [Candidatus Latescibacteria bacterium]|nr:ribbon-helix-helix protein, CopG family [Candidatus Latescibacterota bacterium]
MPAVSFYLPEDLLKELRAEARNRKTSVSRLIRTAVETQLDVETRKKAKAALIRALRTADLGPWNELHEERTKESDDRS